MLSMFAVAVELSCRRDAIILSLPCSSFELIPLIIATTQEHWGSDQVIFKDNKLNMHSTGSEAADEDKCSRWNMEWKLCSTS